MRRTALTTGRRRFGALGVALLMTLAGCGDSSSLSEAASLTTTSTVSDGTVQVAGTLPPASIMPPAPIPGTPTAFGPGEQPGEIFLEPGGSHGPDPFTGEIFSDPVVTTTAPITTSTAPSTVTTQPGQVVVTGHAGDEPGLYGGTRDNARCDEEGMLAFLTANPDLADAWVAALNADPTLRWDEGRHDQLTPADLPAYFDELTPVTLLSDTRVTNHGFRDGRPTPRQSVFEAGTAVLVDAYGVPRARCACGNPLTPPEASPTPPTYVGEAWPEFGDTVIVVVQPATVIIDVVVLIDLVTGDPFERPAGSTGEADAPADGATGVTAIEVSGTVEASGGWAIDAPYDTITFTVDLDPADIDWIALGGAAELIDYGTGPSNAEPADGVPDIIFGNVDDLLVVTAAKDGVNASINVHDNDAWGAPIGNQAVIYGSHPSVWHVAAIDWSADPPITTTVTNPEFGELTEFIDSQGAGTYTFEVMFWNLWTDRVAHGVLYLLVGAAR